MLESLFDKAPVDVAKFLKAGFFIWLLQWLLLLIQRRPSMTFIECNLNWTSLFWVLIVSHNSLFYFYFLDMAFLMEMLLSKFIEITLRHGCSPVNLLHVFRKPFTNNNSKRLLLHGIIFNLVENQNAFSLFQSFLVYAILCHRINVFNSFCFFIIRQKTKAK